MSLQCLDVSCFAHMLVYKLEVTSVKIPTFNKELVLLLYPTAFLLLSLKEFVSTSGIIFCKSSWLLYVVVAMLKLFEVIWCRIWVLFIIALNIKSNNFSFGTDLLRRLCNSAFRSRLVDLPTKKVFWKCLMKHPDWVCYVSDSELIFFECLNSQLFSLLYEDIPNLSR